MDSVKNKFKAILKISGYVVFGLYLLYLIWFCFMHFLFECFGAYPDVSLFRQLVTVVLPYVVTIGCLFYLLIRVFNNIARVYVSELS